MIYDHISEDQEPDYDNTLYPDDHKNPALVIVVAIIMAATALWIISQMGLYNPN
jgi:hypothetical protein